MLRSDFSRFQTPKIWGAGRLITATDGGQYSPVKAYSCPLPTLKNGHRATALDGFQAQKNRKV
jgi:hypothetical protein